MSEHAASKRGGWGIRMFGGPMGHPDGSTLNNYSLGDVVAYDSKEEAQRAARKIRRAKRCDGTRFYDRVSVERVRKGQRQSSIAEAEAALALSAAVAEEREACARVADSYRMKDHALDVSASMHIAACIRARGA